MIDSTRVLDLDWAAFELEKLADQTGIDTRRDGLRRIATFLSRLADEAAREGAAQ